MFKTVTRALVVAIACASVTTVIPSGATVAAASAVNRFHGQIHMSLAAPKPPPGPRNGPKSVMSST